MLIRIQNLPYQIPLDEVWRLCSRYGRISSVQVFSAFDSNHPPAAWAMVQIDEEGGRRAIEELDGGAYGGYILHLHSV